jgi:hypothetical protein
LEEMKDPCRYLDRFLSGVCSYITVFLQFGAMFFVLKFTTGLLRLGNQPIGKKLVIELVSASQVCNLLIHCELAITPRPCDTDSCRKAVEMWNEGSRSIENSALLIVCKAGRALEICTKELQQSSRLGRVL